MKNCHIVPQSYLKSWKIPETKQSIYIFKKSRTFTTANKNISNLLDTNFAIKDKYIIGFSNTSCMCKLYTEFLGFLSDNNINAYYNNEPIDCEDKYVSSIFNIENWVYIDTETGKTLPTQTVKSKWKNGFAKSIEEYFCKNIENSWNQILNYINNHVVKRSCTVRALFYDKLLEFSIVQLLRRQENMENLGLTNSIAIVKNIVQDILPPNEIDKIFDDELTESSWIYQLYKYVIQHKQGIGINNVIDLCIELIKAHYQPCLIISSEKNEFITSDNPCFFNKIGHNLTHGMYLPINPKVCLFMCEIKEEQIKRNHYILLDANDINVGYINHLISQNAYKETAFYGNNITHLKNHRFNIGNWYNMISVLLQNNT